MARKGLAVGQGKGYRNIVGRDSGVHRDSAQGIKQPQQVNIIKPIKYKTGDIIHTKRNASSEYQDTNGIITEDSKPNSEFVSVSLVSNNGTRGIWAVHKDEIEGLYKQNNNLLQKHKIDWSEKARKKKYSDFKKGKTIEWERNRTEEDGLVKRWFENPNDFNQVISVVDDPNISSEQDVRVTYKDKSGKYKNFEVRASKSIIENKNDAEIIDFVQKHIDRGAGKDSVLN